MKKQLILIGLAAGLSLVSARADDKEHTQLGKDMEAMNDAFKAFRRETDPVKGAAQAREAQAALIKGFGEVPALIKEMPDGPEKAKALVEYHKQIGKLYVTLCEVEGAFLDGKTEEVAKLIDSLKEQKKSGHEKFIEKEE